MNFDGATFVEKGKAGLGAVIRNSEGLVMASLSQLIPLPLTAIEVETFVARQAIELALELGFNNVELKGYSEILIKVLKSSNRSLAQYRHIVSNIHYLASHFSVFNLL